MRFQCSHCNSIVAIDDSECGNPVGCGNCGGVTTVPETRFSPGAVINDFIIKKVIGHGGMGQVYLAHQQSLDRPVALKILMEEFSRNSEFIVDFVKEARAAARLNHPNIVQSYAVGEEDGVYFFAMEYVEGETLTELLHREGFIPLDQGINIIQQISEALDFAWKNQQLVHRDVKPDNIMLTSRGVAKLADLGLARAASELAEELQQDEVMGTPQYICPEQLLGQPMDTRGDIYSLGATFYQMITGTFPFEGKSAAEIARKHLQEPLTPPHEVNRELPEVLSWVIAKMMAKKAENRYNDGAQLANDLSLLLRGDVPSGYDGKKPPKNAFRATARAGAAPPPAVVIESDDEEYEDEDEDVYDEDAGEAVVSSSAAGKATGSGMRLKKKGAKTKLKLGGGKDKKKLHMGTGTKLNAAPPGDDDDASDEEADEATDEETPVAERTMVVPGLQGKPKRRSKMPLVIGGGVAALLLAIAGFWAISYFSALSKLPTTTQEATEYYFNTETTKPEERAAFERLQPYIGKVESHVGDVETLRRVTALASQFVNEYQNSLFVKSAAEVDYADAFNVSNAMAKRIEPHARPLAGIVPGMLGTYEEALVRALRRQLRAEEEVSIKERQAMAQQEEAWATVEEQVQAYAKQRARKLSQDLRRFVNSQSARETRFTEEKQQVRLRTLSLTVDRAFTEALNGLRRDQRSREGYPDSVAIATQVLLRDSEIDAANLEIRRISQEFNVDRSRVQRAMTQAFVAEKLEDVRREMQRMPAQEQEMMQKRQTWFNDMIQAVEMAQRYHQLVAGSGDKLQNEPIRVNIPKRANQELRIGRITRESIMVNIVEFGSDARYVTRQTVAFPLQELPLRDFIAFAKKSWGPQDPREYALLLGVYVYHLLRFDDAKTVLESSDANISAFLLEEMTAARGLQLTIQLNKLVDNVKQMVDGEDEANARKYALAIQKRYGEEREFASIKPRLEELVGALPAPEAPDTPAPQE